MKKIHGCTIRIPDSGGKAGKGRNKTGTVQVLKDNMLKGQFRFNVDSIESLGVAMKKAEKLARTL